MKKILIALSVLFIMSGCDTNTESLTCTSTNTANGITTTTTYDIDYVDEDVKNITITYDYNQDKDENDVDGVNSDTDGLEEDNDNNDNNLDSDDVVDGVVGDVIDETVEGVTETILDIAGIKNNVENQLTMYDDIEGFSYDVDLNTNDKYRVIYKIDMTKINDTDLANFNVKRNLTDLRTNYETIGYTCK